MTTQLTIDRFGVHGNSVEKIIKAISFGAKSPICSIKWQTISLYCRSHAGGRRFEPTSPHQSRASTRKRVAGTLLFSAFILANKFSANALNMRSGARHAPGLFCLFKALKPAFYAFSVQRILKSFRSEKAFKNL